jgi:hypothetical protein
MPHSNGFLLDFLGQIKQHRIGAIKVTPPPIDYREVPGCRVEKLKFMTCEWEANGSARQRG